mmetsp:Transcript_24180/g.75990  ORF Transcript_24180/g.75990 Transcript_24180/m.75990 type:complete len:259 (-) Transcript_24180:179-955(-)
MYCPSCTGRCGLRVRMFALSARLLQPLSAAPRLPSLPRGRRNSASPPRRGARTACKAAMTKHVDGIAEVAGTYEGWLLDQFGVLHDGRVAYPCAIEAVRELHAAGKKVLIISNSSRRSSTTLEKLRPMGFDPSWFAGAITSGEITHRYLESSAPLPPLAPGSAPAPAMAFLRSTDVGGGSVVRRARGLGEGAGNQVLALHVGRAGGHLPRRPGAGACHLPRARCPPTHRHRAAHSCVSGVPGRVARVPSSYAGMRPSV